LAATSWEIIEIEALRWNWNMSGKIAMLISEKEKRLIEELRKIRYGEVLIVQIEGQPAEIDKIKEKIRL
jgi:hypothetical protein